MRIGIDIGGSHIAIGLVQKEKILQKIEHNFSNEEKDNLELSLKKVIHNAIDNILKNTSIEKIEKIGISVPRKTKKRLYKICS